MIRLNGPILLKLLNSVVFTFHLLLYLGSIYEFLSLQSQEILNRPVCVLDILKRV